MKTFNWNKLPVNKIWGKNNIWSQVAKKNEKPSTQSPKMDFSDMENLFCQQVAVSPQPSLTGTSNKEATATDGKKKEEVGMFCHFFYLIKVHTNLENVNKD